MRRILIVLAFAVSAHAAPALRILFVGNSLTYSNDMPGTVQRLAGARATVTTVAFPNYSLEDHLQDRRTLAALGQPWDVVVLQQGPSALESSRTALLRDARAIRKRTKAKLALLTVWPARSRLGDFGRVIESYRLAAKEVGGVVIPAGAAWQNVLREHAELELYSSDGFHPSATGSLLTAIAVQRTLLGPASCRDAECATLTSAVEAALR